MAATFSIGGNWFFWRFWPCSASSLEAVVTLAMHLLVADAAVTHVNQALVADAVVTLVGGALVWDYLGG